MSFEPDSLDSDLSVIGLLQAILLELKRLNVMVSEMSGQVVKNEDVQ